MESEATTIQRIDIDGVDVGLRLEVVQRGGGRQTVGLTDPLSFDRITKLLTAIATGVKGAVATASPTKASVELGVEFGLEGGALIALIAKGTTKANIKLTLEWEADKKDAK